MHWPHYALSPEAATCPPGTWHLKPEVVGDGGPEGIGAEGMFGEATGVSIWYSAATVADGGVGAG